MKLLIINLAILLCCSTKTDNINDRSEDFRECCIHGHIYYYAGNTYSTVIKLTDDGKPIKCPTK